MSETTIKEITVGAATYQVAELPEQIQKLVSFYEFAVNGQAKAEREFVVAKSAATALGAEISNAVAQMEAAAAASAEESAPVEAVDESAE